MNFRKSEFDIPLTAEEKIEKINFLRKKRFKEFKIHPYYINSYIKHAVDLETIKEVYYQFEKITDIFKRPANKGFKYSFIYKLDENKSLTLCFFLDENPPKFFNAFILSSPLRT